MMNASKFDEMIAIAEAFPSATTFPTAPSTSALSSPATTAPSSPTSFGARLGATAGAVGSAIGSTFSNALKDPRAARQAGITGMISNAIKRGKETFAKIRDKQLLEYYNRLDCPDGPPKQGSMFKITATDGIYVGKVASLSNINGLNVATIDTIKQGGSANQPTRRYVVELDPKTRAYFSPRSVMVSDMAGALPSTTSGAAAAASKAAGAGTAAKNIPTSGFVKNEAESNNNYTLKYDAGSKSFLLGPNKTYAVLMLQGNYSSNLQIGAKVKGIDMVTKQPIEGVVSGPVQKIQDPNTKQMINVYPVEANFK
jgi:hypothetical protein